MVTRGPFLGFHCRLYQTHNANRIATSSLYKHRLAAVLYEANIQYEADFKDAILHWTVWRINHHKTGINVSCLLALIKWGNSPGWIHTLSPHSSLKVRSLDKVRFLVGAAWEKAGVRATSFPGSFISGGRGREMKEPGNEVGVRTQQRVISTPNKACIWRHFNWLAFGHFG